MEYLEFLIQNRLYCNVVEIILLLQIKQSSGWTNGISINKVSVYLQIRLLTYKWRLDEHIRKNLFYKLYFVLSSLDISAMNCYADIQANLDLLLNFNKDAWNNTNLNGSIPLLLDMLNLFIDVF